MTSKIILLFLIGSLTLCEGDQVPESIRELQKFYGDGTDKDYSNVFYKRLENAEGLPTQAAEILEQHLRVGDYGFENSHVKEFVKNMKLISETEIKNAEDLTVLRKQLYDSSDHFTALNMEMVLHNRDDGEEARKAFDEVFLKKDANRLVQLYYTSDEDIFSGVIVAAKRKNEAHAVYLVFVID